MSGQEITQKIQTTEPTLKDLLDLLRKDIMLSLNCHAIATVQSFDSTKQTVVATINYQKTYFDRNAQGQYVPVLQNYPILVDCPVVILGGGGATLTFPIQAGDQCLILFNDRDINNWFAGAMSGPVASSRAHSLSDGIALVGLRPQIASYDSTRAVLQFGTTFIGVSEDKVKIANAMTSLGAIFMQLTMDLNTMATALQGNPTIETAAFAAGQGLATALTSLNTLISELLE